MVDLENQLKLQFLFLVPEFQVKNPFVVEVLLHGKPEP